MANRDPSVFHSPDQLILDRKGNRHFSFGLGVHRCVGSNVARTLFKAMVTATLDRMPDYKCDPAGTVHYDTIGMIQGMRHLPAAFTPARSAVPGSKRRWTSCSVSVTSRNWPGQSPTREAATSTESARHVQKPLAKEVPRRGSAVGAQPGRVGHLDLFFLRPVPVRVHTRIRGSETCSLTSGERWRTTVCEETSRCMSSFQLQEWAMKSAQSRRLRDGPLRLTGFPTLQRRSRSSGWRDTADDRVALRQSPVRLP